MFSLGSKITVSIGKRGERPDFYPGVIVSQPVEKYVADPQTGRQRLVRLADVITAQSTLAGELRLAKRSPQDLAFVFAARMPGDENVELLDGPAGAPKTITEIVRDQAIAAMTYLQSRPASENAVDLDAVDA